MSFGKPGEALEAHPVPRHRTVALVVPMGVALATLGLLGWSAWPTLRPTKSVAVAEAVFQRGVASSVDEDEQQPRSESPVVQAPGWLEAEPYYVACAALADGVVETVEVLEGDRVEAGQVVARLVDEDAQLRVRRAEADLGNAKSKLLLAEADLKAAHRTWEEPVELERAVEAGKASVEEAEAELAQLPSLVASARATLTLLEEEMRRVVRSVEQGATSDLERVVAEQRAAAQRADVEAIEARRAILSARVGRLDAERRAAERDLELRIEDQRRVDAAEASVEAARAEVARTEAMRDEAQLELDRMVIRAPISGFVQARLKAPGDKVARMMDSPHSSHIVHLYDPERLQVRVDVPLADASHVSVGQECEVVVEVLPDRVFRGRVLRITHEADLQKNTLQCKVKVLNPDPVLRPEMLTRVKFLPQGRPTKSEGGGGAGQSAVVLVPPGAVESSSGADRVWIVADRHGGRGVLTSRQVNVVERSGDWLAVSGDLQPGSLVALGVVQPREGQHVEIRPSGSGEAAK